MCRQAGALLVLIAGLIILLLCFVPTWVILLLGISLIALSAAMILLKLKRGR